MEQTGYVTKVSDDRIKVRVIRESSCGGNCVSCKGCPSGIQLIECAAYDGAAVGDRRGFGNRVRIGLGKNYFGTPKDTDKSQTV